MKGVWKIFGILFLGSVLVAGFCGCSGDDDDDDILAYLLLNQSTSFSYAAVMQSCTPYLSSSGNLNTWAGGWRDGSGTGIFEKVLSDSVEGLYGPVETLDQIIEVIDGTASVWNDATSDITDQGVSVGGTSVTVSVDVDLTTVDKIPGIGTLDSAFTVANHIKYVAGDQTVVVAFTGETTNEKLAAYSQTEFDGSDGSAARVEYMGMYANRDQTNGFVEVWMAVVCDYVVDPAGGDFLMRYKWRGFPDAASPWFMLTQYTNACNGDQVVVGGGPKSGTMGFICENGDQGLTDTWYTYVELADVEGTTDGTPVDASVTAPTTATAPGRYINVEVGGNANQVENDWDIPAVSDYCYDWLSDHPTDRSTIAGTGAAGQLWTGSFAVTLP